MTTEQITVTLGGKVHVIYRDEILRGDDKTLRDIFVLREATRVDLQNAEKNVHQFMHALSSIDNTLQQVSVRYITDKLNDSLPIDETGKGDTNNAE